MGSKWSSEEDALLRKLWKTPQTIEQFMHNFHPRTLHAIQERGRTLKLQQRKDIKGMKRGITPENPLMKHVIALVESGGSVMRMSEISARMEGVSHSAVYKACVRAVEGGYLKSQPVKRECGRGRRERGYSRTDKPYVAPIPTKDAIRKRLARERERAQDAMLAEQATAEIHIFRHPLDELLFGAYPKPFEPHPLPRRVYRQSMDVGDEMERAA